MSTNRMKVAARRRESGDAGTTLDSDHRFCLLYGGSPYHDESIATIFGSSSDASRVWKKHSRRLTFEFMENHPGRRPWGWWRWTAPDPVRIEMDDELDVPEKANFDFDLHMHDEGATICEAKVLERHGFLTERERVQIEASPKAKCQRGEHGFLSFN